VRHLRQPPRHRDRDDADGRLAVHFTSCHACEAKAWKQDGRELDISSVLGKAQKHK
jgi:hypothetical protein